MVSSVEDGRKALTGSSAAQGLGWQVPHWRHKCRRFSPRLYQATSLQLIVSALQSSVVYIHHGAQTRSLGAIPKGRQSSAVLVVAE